MAETTYTKLEIACELLDTAMQLYVEKRDYFSIIHLAAAAEELFGKHLPKAERISSIGLKAQISFDVLEKGEEVEYVVAHDQNGERHRRAKEVMLRSKNRIKHMNDKSESDTTITIDPAQAARRWIEDALCNFDKLRKRDEYFSRLPKSSAMWRFMDYENEKAD
jgi:hypothetical protein